MAFQWYMFLLLNPVWNIVNSFSELQRSLAAMERVFEVLEPAFLKRNVQGALALRTLNPLNWPALWSAILSSEKVTRLQRKTQSSPLSRIPCAAASSGARPV